MPFTPATATITMATSFGWSFPVEAAEAATREDERAVEIACVVRRPEDLTIESSLLVLPLTITCSDYILAPTGG